MTSGSDDFNLDADEMTQILQWAESVHSEFYGGWDDPESPINSNLYRRVVVRMHHLGYRRTDGVATNPEGRYWLALELEEYYD